MQCVEECPSGEKINLLFIYFILLGSCKGANNDCVATTIENCRICANSAEYCDLCLEILVLTEDKK